MHVSIFREKQSEAHEELPSKSTNILQGKMDLDSCIISEFFDIDEEFP